LIGSSADVDSSIRVSMDGSYLPPLLHVCVEERVGVRRSGLRPEALTACRF